MRLKSSRLRAFVGSAPTIATDDAIVVRLHVKRQATLAATLATRDRHGCATLQAGRPFSRFARASNGDRGEKAHGRNDEMAEEKISFHYDSILQQTMDSAKRFCDLFESSRLTLNRS
jgi:hypothetical protein